MITDLASGWKKWIADDVSMSVTFPGDYRVLKAVSEGADLSCQSGDGRVLLDVVRMTIEGKLDKDPVDFVVDAYDVMAENPMYENWRVVFREYVNAGPAERAVRFECEFTEQGHQMYTIHLFRGRGPRVANVALKAMVEDRDENASDFEQILNSFETPYLAVTPSSSNERCCSCGADTEDDFQKTSLRFLKWGRGDKALVTLVPIALCSRCRQGELREQTTWGRNQNRIFYVATAAIWAGIFALALYNGDKDVLAAALGSGMAAILGVFFVRIFLGRRLRRKSRILTCSAAVATAKLMERDGWGLSDLLEFS